MSDPNIDGPEEKPTSLSGKIRQFQDSQLNDGWRIQMIPIGDLNLPMVEFNVISLMGALGFLVGAGMVWNGDPHTDIAIGFISSGLTLAFFGLWFKAKNSRRKWEMTPARCVDSQLKMIWVYMKGGRRQRWQWRFVCEFEYRGTQYRVTPEVYWANFTSMDSALVYFDKHVSAGTCSLRFDPKNPLLAELANQGIKELLFYNRLTEILITTAAVALLIFGINKCLPKSKTSNKATSASQTVFVGGPTSMKVTTNMALRIESTDGVMSMLRFTAFGEDTATYRWINRTTSGGGALREAYDRTNRSDGKTYVIPKPGNDTTVCAGNIELGWSYGGKTSGWIYYATNRAKITVLNANDFTSLR